MLTPQSIKVFLIITLTLFVSSPHNPVHAANKQQTLTFYRYQSNDSDYDGLDDTWELAYFGDLFYNATDDPEWDGCNNGCEEAQGTNPTVSDTDADGLKDGQEIYTYHTDPLNVDTDADALNDGTEVNGWVTGGGIHYDSDPLLVDSDADGFTDYQEKQMGTNPRNGDTDGDGLLDVWEITYFHDLSQSGSGDPDADGLDNTREMYIGTNPLSVDSDGDGLSDRDEFYTYGTDPLKVDTDSDGLRDGTEVNGWVTGAGIHYDSDPLAPNSDGDGFSDYQEKQNGTNPRDGDTDHDNLTDSDEINVYHTDPTKADSDGDGLTDYDEVITYHTNPLKADTDNDGLTDYQEVEGVTVNGKLYYSDPNRYDTDNDGLSDGQEIIGVTINGIERQDGVVNGLLCQSNPLTVDTDGDGLGDYTEAQYNICSSLVDTDGDTLPDGDEIYRYGIQFTNPTKWDTYGNGYSDAYNIAHGTIPYDGDYDGLNDAWEMNYFHNLSQKGSGNPDADGCDNACEQRLGTNPLSADSDGDGLSDGAEVNTYHTNPIKVDTDNDGLKDSDEINTYSTNPLLVDSDNDTTPNNLGNSLSDYNEIFIYSTNPNSPDTDGDGFSDYDEIFIYHTDPSHQVNLSIPVPTSPTDSSATTDPQPTFKWTGVSGAVTYDVKLDIINPPSEEAIYQHYNVGATFKPPGPLYAGVYYWQIRAVDINGIPSPWSDVQILTVNSAAGAAPTRDIFTVHTPLLTWNSLTWATGYQIEISDSITFSTTVIDSPVLMSNTLSWTTAPLPNRTWYWRVRARRADDVSWGDWSLPQSFSIIVP